MPFYEITYETGRMSVAFYDSDEEGISATGAHHARAVKGEAGGPLGAPAERVARVRVYKKHPNDYNPDQTMSAEVLAKEVGALLKAHSDENGVVSIDQFALAVRSLSHPMVSGPQTEPFASQFLMKEDRVLDLAY